jgi:HEAT repeat protein
LNKRRVVLVLAGLTLFAILAVLLWPADSSEPRYNGKKLSKWLIMYRNPDTLSDQQNAEAAISAIGTNAIPFLLRWLQDEPLPTRTRIRNALPGWLRDSPMVFNLLGAPFSRTMTASMGFLALGTNALPAIPELMALSRTNNRTAGAMAVLTLAQMGQPGLAATLTIVTNGSGQHRIFAMTWMAQDQALFSNPAPVIPALLISLTDTNPLVVQKAAEALAVFRLEPEIVVPRLADAVTNARPAARVAAIMALQAYGSDAAPALCAISNCLNDRLAGVSNTAARAIQTILTQNPQQK